ncbi:hypothetical protein HF257_31595 [Pseudomonas sp. WS 5106]|uniref:Uncharacterized protein n=1 Tax=Pseudomonas cremoris TaxID=2724178 RepID=A0A7X1ATQ4_9PSED|nr:MULTISPECIES: hypothetical protein [Pseudomonas]MBC2384836.1 hypothetical protein [Pseudomonas cremoris]MBC2410578.1 hypothetical protein [Pseudomonas cremoris]
MSERAYPLTEEEQLKQRILTPQPVRHFGEFDHLTGKQRKPAEPGKTVEP